MAKTSGGWASQNAQRSSGEKAEAARATREVRASTVAHRGGQAHIESRDTERASNAAQNNPLFPNATPGETQAPQR